MSRSLKTALVLVFLAALPLMAIDTGQAPVLAKNQVVIDPDGPRNPWGKAIGDIDGDGRPDIVVGGHQKSRLGIIGRVMRKIGLLDRSATRGELVWYQNPGWRKHSVSDAFFIRTDIAVGDINADGRNDLVIAADEGLFWLQNPNWSATRIDVGEDLSKFHDVELSDLDRDGDLDIVVRNQSLFDHNDGDLLHMLFQQPQMNWQSNTLIVPHGEGLEVSDLNADGFDDIIVNDVWLANPGAGANDSVWAATDYTSEWNWSHVYIAAHDINADGKQDIVLSPSEPESSVYRISWFEAPSANDGDWIEHIVDEGVESVHHFVGAGDFDGDGDADIFSAEMNQGSDPDEVKVYLNSGDSMSWTKQILGTGGSHSMQVADLDGDNRVDVVGANWHIEEYSGEYPVTLWRSDNAREKQWQRHVIGDNAPWHNLFVYAADIDGDGFPDVVTGRSWFRNPGVIGRSWSRQAIGSSFNTAYYVADLDADGDIDIFGSEWDGLLRPPGLLLRLRAKLSGTGYPGSRKGGAFLWASNDGSGHFDVFDNIEVTDGDYPQGVAFHVDDNGPGLVVSWHQPGVGIDRVSIPHDPYEEPWTTRNVSAFSQDEELSCVDLDDDGIEEVITGTSWLSPSNSWKINTFHQSKLLPDRHEVVDLDGNGRLDVVVGYEAISSPGKLAWYRDIETAVPQGADEFVIDYPTGPMSLGAADIDGDKDIDLVVGEHNLTDPSSARLLLYENPGVLGSPWQTVVVSAGDEHHNGALVLDIDLDGDLDIVSIGWGHSEVLLFENKSSN